MPIFLHAGLLARMMIVAVSLVYPALAAFAQEPSAPIGTWDGSMQTAAGAANFGIDLKILGGRLEGTLLNDTDRQPFSSAAWDGKVLTLRLDYYDGTLTAHVVSPRRMEGEYSRQTSTGIVHIPLVLVPHREALAEKPWSGPSLSGEWTFHRPGQQGAERITLAEFYQQNVADPEGQVLATGIFEPVSGDTGLLHGNVFKADGSTRFHLSRFDGIHLLAFDGEFLPDGSLRGRIGSGTSGISPFTATRSSDVSSIDPNVQGGRLTRVTDPQEPFRFTGVDATGRTLDQNSREFKGKPIIVDIFGTWCPNCHDEAPVLEKLYKKYHPQGLEIVALAYEYTADQGRDQRLIEIYRAKYGLTFPLLLSGTTAEGQIAKTLPQLVDFGAYPTTIFLDRNGRVRAVHAGFSGPATGEKYEQVQQHFDELAREILGTSN